MFKSRQIVLALRRSFKQKIKQVVPEKYLETQPDTKPHVIGSLNDLVAQSEIYDPKKFERNLKDENPIPISSVLGPIEVPHPKVGEKYKWCSCGLSLRQPFCDGAHKGTSFKSKTFIIEEPVHSIHLCGCKLSTNAPFCDFQTCKELKKAAEKNE